MIESLMKILAMLLGYATKEQSKGLERKNEEITERKLNKKFPKKHKNDSVYDGI